MKTLIKWFNALKDLFSKKKENPEDALFRHSDMDIMPGKAVEFSSEALPVPEKI